MSSTQAVAQPAGQPAGNPAKPAPRLSAINRPFWQACNDERLMLQRCAAPQCRRFVFYPRACCPHCGGGALTWEQASGAGTVTTFTVVHRPHHESFYAEAPFVFAAVTLDEGVLIYTRIECDPEAVDDLIGTPVEVVFRALSPTQKAPYFRPAAR
ncbi:OB-fold domain-containing protein [Xanthobacter sp. KR7-225]|uniref:Zn-ribbon domain-containing OB-fold protein n=1 Tax=Xanthobacter sp. KR7-225 TaxID=3156613 RepID=UPI0032B3C1B9